MSAVTGGSWCSTRPPRPRGRSSWPASTTAARTARCGRSAPPKRWPTERLNRDTALQSGRIGRRARSFRAHRRAGRGDRRAARAAGGDRRRRRGQDRDDGRPRGVAGRQRLRPARRGARADVHPQGRRAAAAPGPHPAGPAGRAGPRVPADWTRPTSRRRSAPTTRSPDTLLREHGLLLPVEPGTRLLSETELWQLAFRVVSEHPASWTPTRRRPRSPRWCCGCPVSWPSTSSTPTSCATPTSSWSGWCTRCPPVRISATAVPASGCCGCWPPRPSAPSWCR